MIMISKILLVLCLALSTVSCGAASLLPAAVAAVSDAEAVLSIVERAVDTWTTTSPDPELRQRANLLIADAWTALRIANATLEGAESLSEDDRAQAFKQFQIAYSELHTFLKQHGILSGSGFGGPGEVEFSIPEPTAMKF
jgi:hypothetical protein